MEIRLISPEENILKLKIQSIAFLFSQDFSAAAQNTGVELQELTDHTTCRAAFNDEGRMCSCLDLIPFEVRFDGKTVKSGGIAAVATLPEERQKRYVRKLFENIMAEMYESDYTFSYLYPFSHPYYRKFGYELNMLRRSFCTGVQNLKHIEQTGYVKMYSGETELAEIRQLYDEFISDKNLAVVRSEKLWKQFLEKDPYKDTVYLYVWHYSSGKARGYIKFGVENVQGAKPNMNVHELIWRDLEALKGILGFIGSYSSHMEKILWQAPDFFDLTAFLPEPSELKHEIQTCGMNRIVNAEKALRLMSSPEGSGSATIAVFDDFFPQNSGSYTITWENGAHVVTRTQAAPDMSCDIQALSQLVTGFCTINELSFTGRIELHNNKEALSRVFLKKPLFINTFF